MAATPPDALPWWQRDETWRCSPPRPWPSRACSRGVDDAEYLRAGAALCAPCRRRRARAARGAGLASGRRWWRWPPRRPSCSAPAGTGTSPRTWRTRSSSPTWPSTSSSSCCPSPSRGGWLPAWTARPAPWLTAALIGPAMFWPFYDIWTRLWGTAWVGVLPVLLAAASVAALSGISGRFAAGGRRRRRRAPFELPGARSPPSRWASWPRRSRFSSTASGSRLAGRSRRRPCGGFSAILPHPGLKYFGLALFAGGGSPFARQPRGAALPAARRSAGQLAALHLRGAGPGVLARRALAAPRRTAARRCAGLRRAVRRPPHTRRAWPRSSACCWSSG